MHRCLLVFRCAWWGTTNYVVPLLAPGQYMYVGATCPSSKNDLRRLKIKGRSGFQCSFECCHWISGCVGTDLVIYRCFWTEGVHVCPVCMYVPAAAAERALVQCEVRGIGDKPKYACTAIKHAFVVFHFCAQCCVLAYVCAPLHACWLHRLSTVCQATKLSPMY